MSTPNLARSISQFCNEAKWVPLSHEEEIQLIIQAKSGDSRARDIIIKSQLRYVIRFVRKYQGLGLSLEDLIQYGSIAVCEAIETFEPERGFRFNTYVKWKALGEISNALTREGATVRIPHNRKDRKQNNKSISDPIKGSDSPETYADLYLVDTSENSKVDPELGSDLADALLKIKPRQAEAICRFFGFGYEYAQSMEQIGDEMGIGAEAARLLVRGAERSLKKLDDIDKFREYL
jgi:RNA polymerase sigma factor (sigma-70 family)